jgi:hypothetical protein
MVSPGGPKGAEVAQLELFFSFIFYFPFLFSSLLNLNFKSYPPYKESRPRDLGRTRKKVGKVYA